MPGRRSLRAQIRDQALEKARYERVVRLLRQLGCHVSRFSQPRASKQTAGIPDLFWMHVGWGLSGFMELKTDTGRLSDAQLQWMRVAVAAGVRVAVVRSEDDALAVLEAAGAPIRRTA